MDGVFSIGDRVVALVPVGHRMVVDVWGTIVCFEEDPDYIGVEFDEDIGGHGLYDEDEEEDRCEDGYGWWVLPSDLSHGAKLDDLHIQDCSGLF